MLIAVACAFGAMVAYGVSTVLQAVGARRAGETDGLDVRLIGRLARQVPYLAGLGLDALGVVLTVVALRRLPLFFVQSAIAGSLAVTALVATRVIDARLSPREWGAVAAVGAGLVVVASAAGAEAPPATSLTSRLILLALVTLTALVSALVARVPGSRGAALMGLAAGFGFGLGNTALRVITDLWPRALVTNVATYAAIGGAVLGALVFATALQRGSTTVVTAMMVVGETVFPALYGVIALHERPRAGWAPVAIVGFVVTVGAALVLARFSEPAAD